MTHRQPSSRQAPRPNSSGTRRAGAAMVETAAVLAAWLVLLLGTLDLGMVLTRHTLAHHLAANAVRLAAVRGANASPQVAPWGPTTVQVTLDQSHPVADRLRPFTGGFPPSQFLVRLEWPDGDNQRDQRVIVRVTSSQPTALTGLLPGDGSVPLQTSQMCRISY